MPIQDAEIAPLQTERVHTVRVGAGFAVKLTITARVSLLNLPLHFAELSQKGLALRHIWKHDLTSGVSNSWGDIRANRICPLGRLCLRGYKNKVRLRGLRVLKPA